MDGLTLDEAIEREKEVAERNRKDIEFIKEDSKKYDKSSNSIKNYENIKANDELIKSCMINAEKHEQLAEWLEELKQYKDAEEQGTLMKLPCKPGDTVYVIADNKKIYPLMAKNEISIIHGELHILCESHCYSDLCCHDDLNKRLFLTLEKANKALERIKKCCGTCLYFCGEVGDEEQFCDEKEIYVSEKNWCCKYKSINEE